MDADRFYLSGNSAVHGLPAQVKITAALTFILVVVLTPREWITAFVVDALLLAVVIALAALPVGVVVRRMGIEAPFVVFAVLLPFIAQGTEVQWGPLTLSEPGLWAAWNILVKATLGVAVSVVLAATTRAGDLVAGMGRLHVPGLLVQIASFMIRYVDVVAGEASRMRVARAARGFTPSSVRAWPDLARSLGTLFVRTYERGERVQVAMLSRGYDGSSDPWQVPQVATPRAWLAALAVPACALGALTVMATRT